MQRAAIMVEAAFLDLDNFLLYLKNQGIILLASISGIIFVMPFTFIQQTIFKKE